MHELNSSMSSLILEYLQLLKFTLIQRATADDIPIMKNAAFENISNTATMLLLLVKTRRISDFEQKCYRTQNSTTAQPVK